MNKILIFFIMLSIGACSSDPPLITSTAKNPVRAESVSLVFRASYDVTWRCAVKAMDQYNLKISNKDAGTILTETIKRIDDTYESSTSIKNKEIRTPTASSIEVKITPIEKAENGFSRTEVSVIKFVEKLDDFGRRQIKSNLIEEQVIVYRIKRLLELERMKFERNRN